MNKTLRILLVGVALIGAVAPALAQSAGGGNGGGGGGGGGGGNGGGGGSSNVWDPTIAESALPRARALRYRYPDTTIPPQRRETVEILREDTCGMYRGRVYCRPVY